MANIGSYLLVEVAKASEALVSYSGTKYYHVQGIVKLKGVPSPRRIVLLDRRTLAYIASCYSKADGSFEFKPLPQQAFRDYYVVLAFDDSKKYHAEAVDFVKQVETAGG